MEIYLMKARIRDGESEYLQWGMIKAATSFTASKLADRHCERKGGYFYFGDHRTPEIKGLIKITPEQAATLQELNIAHFAN